MLDVSSLGKWIVFGGLLLGIFGAMIWIAGKIELPFGRLPGDIRVERSGFSFYFPIVSCLLVSVLVTIGLNLIVKLLRR